MRYVTNLMINEFNLRNIGCDFMGYKLQKDELSVDSRHPVQFHHLIIPKRECLDLPDYGYNINNGAILTKFAHEELHKIEHYERKMFDMITKLMIIENRQRFLDKQTLLEIRIILEEFEYLYENKTTKKGTKVIKDNYIKMKMTLPELNSKVEHQILHLTPKL